MNLFALAIRNIRRNFNKYVMYFFSLSFCVFTTYSFLELMQNKYVQLAYEYDTQYKAILTIFGVIIFVFVFFFLINSNNSFIKARKREISTYALFGMSNYRIGRLMLLETLMVGAAALVIGMGTGIFFSKLLVMAILSLSMLGYPDEIKFIIEAKPIIYTVGMFLLVFCIMGLSGYGVIRRFELIDLFKAEKASEGKIKGSKIALAMSVILIIVGYYFASSPNAQTVAKMSLQIVLLVIAGTYLFFWGGLPLILEWLKKKDSYRKSANLIAIAGFAHRIKTASISMATIAILSAVATTVVATGYSLYHSSETNAYETVGFDMCYAEGQGVTIDEITQVFDQYENKIVDVMTINCFELVTQIEPIKVEERTHYEEEQDKFRVYSQSQYNELSQRAKSKTQKVTVNKGEAVFIYDFLNDNYREANQNLLIPLSDEKSIRITSSKRIPDFSYNLNYTLVIHDDDFKQLQAEGIISKEPKMKMTAINYTNALNSPETYKALSAVVKEPKAAYAYSIYSESIQMFGLICFIGFFMCGIFILMTASMLYFKQMTAAEEEKKQYRMLEKIGMDKTVQKKVVSRRLLPMFFIPLGTGIIHSVFAMKAADTMVFRNIIPVEHSYLVILGLSAMMYALYALVYGVFYLVTKGQYEKTINK